MTHCMRIGACVLAVLFAGSFAIAQENAWWQQYSYYNEDEWYDPTDWFDGNNYEFDKQAYEAYRQESKTNRGAQYGYGNDDYRDDWFYDYYDDGYALHYDRGDDGDYDYYLRYYDYDQDGLSDAFTGFYDLDRDGIYDEVDYYTFGRAAGHRDDQATRQAADAKRYQIEGKVSHTKKVQVRDTEHLVVSVTKQDGQTIVVDLGPADALGDLGLGEGDSISVRGPATHVGDKRILLAQQLSLDGETTTIDRSGQRFKGEITDLRRAQVRGTPHRLATLETDDGSRLLVDLGAVRHTQNMEFTEGDQITVSGPQVRVQGRKVIMATRLAFNGQSRTIDRGLPGGRQLAARKQPGRIEGEVARLKYVNVRGAEHVVAHVDTRRGRVIVDLGAADQLEAEIGNGESLSAQGQLVQAHGRTVLLARHVEVGDESFEIRRDEVEQRISGEVLETRTVKLRGTERLLARVQSSKGDRMLIDLGPQSKLDERPNSGDQIRATGIVVKAGERPVLVARQFRLGDETVQVDRRRSAR